MKARMLELTRRAELRLVRDEEEKQTEDENEKQAPRCARGKVGDVGELLLAVWTAARDKARALTGNRADAEDVASEVMENVWMKLEEDPGFLSDPTERARFVCTAVVNRVCNRWRDRKRQERREPTIARKLESRRSTWSNPDEEFSERVTRMVIDRAVDTLPARCREIWYLRQAEGMKPRAIAEHLEIEVATVKGHVKQALRVIRSALEDADVIRPGEKR